MTKEGTCLLPVFSLVSGDPSHDRCRVLRRSRDDERAQDVRRALFYRTACGSCSSFCVADLARLTLQTRSVSTKEKIWSHCSGIERCALRGTMRRSFKFEETHYATLLTLSFSKLAEIPQARWFTRITQSKQAVSAEILNNSAFSI